jgi:hypothetical protein
MGRNACTLSATAHVPSDGVLVLDTPLSSGASGASWVFLTLTGPQQRARRCCSGTSSEAPRLSELLIDLLQQVADGQLTRLIFRCPTRHGKSQLVSRFLTAYWVSRHQELFCAIAR